MSFTVHHVDSEGNVYIPSYFGAYENEETGEAEDVSGITALIVAGTSYGNIPNLWFH